MRSTDLLSASTRKMAGSGQVRLQSGSLLPPYTKTAFPVSFDIEAYARILEQMTKLYPYDPDAVAASVSALGHASNLPMPFTGANILHASNRVHNNSSLKSESVKETMKNNSTTKELENGILCAGNDRALDLSTQGLKSLFSNYKRIAINQIKPKIIEDTWVENDVSLVWTDSKIAAYNPAQKLFMCVDCECVGFLSRVAEHWLGAHANLRVFHCPRCPYTSAWSRCVKMHLTRQHNEQFADTTMWKENATLLEVTKLMQELRTKVETKIDSSNSFADKRFYCPHCPYATDRRDLYTRHENIHKDNKPFHCYICFKQFNRADHVKKHFVRMHPESEYDISKIRKHSSDSKVQSPSPPDSECHIRVPDKTKTTSKVENNENCINFSSLRKLSAFEAARDAVANLPGPVARDEVPSSPESVAQIPQVSLLPLSTKQSPPPEMTVKSRKRGDRAYTCHYCHWSGSDNWCLKRHMNTHIKPFVCIMCDYKAARAERLSTHVWKVHSKRICNKCNFLADTQERLLEHTREEHHNNPYSRRHICSSCGMSFDTRANLETHSHLTHTRPESPGDIVHITPLLEAQRIQDIAQDLSLKRQHDSPLSLICPVEDCSQPCESSGILADHVRKFHGGLFASRCPHCSYSLTQDDMAKDHWMSHHEDVCGACVHVFTSVYGPQLWKKVHIRSDSMESPLDAAVTGSCPGSPASDSGKRKRKQSCPKKVITFIPQSDCVRKRPMKCLKCAHLPTFSSIFKLIEHTKLRHKVITKKRFHVKRIHKKSSPKCSSKLTMKGFRY